MEIKLTKDWKRRNGTVKKGTVLEVTNPTAKGLIKKKMAKPVKENAFTRLMAKSVQDDGTKQTKRKIQNKKEKVNGDSREI